MKATINWNEEKSMDRVDIRYENQHILVDDEATMADVCLKCSDEGLIIDIEQDGEVIKTGWLTLDDINELTH